MSEIAYLGIIKVLNLVPYSHLRTLNLQDIKTRGSKALPTEGDGAVPVIVNSKIVSYVVPAKEYEAMSSIISDVEDLGYYLAHKNDEMIDESEFWDQVGI